MRLITSQGYESSDHKRFMRYTGKLSFYFSIFPYNNSFIPIYMLMVYVYFSVGCWFVDLFSCCICFLLNILQEIFKIISGYIFWKIEVLNLQKILFFLYLLTNLDINIFLIALATWTDTYWSWPFSISFLICITLKTLIKSITANN